MGGKRERCVERQGAKEGNVEGEGKVGWGCHRNELFCTNQKLFPLFPIVFSLLLSIKIKKLKL